ncbi:MAG: hypothetical protein IJ692_01235 [Alloprevotella sp.]|nr:hypothetical protein [Alloprevotella sp.]MBR1651995.1 hypothetical protein [Alloprevotella sp.]
MVAGFFAACSSIDCPLDNIVGMTVTLYSSESRTPLTLADSLTVRVAGSDTILLNRGFALSSFIMPLRYATGTDTLLFRFSNDNGQSATDTIFLSQEVRPHFENIDCPAAIFHQLCRVRWTSHALREMPLTVDSVALRQTLVNYDNNENLRVYLRSTASE